MIFDTHGTLAYSTVQTSSTVIGSTSGTSVILATGDGAKFTVGQNATIWPSGAAPTLHNATYTGGNAEIVRITAKSTDTLTVTRSQENTTALNNIAVGFQIANTVTPKTLTDIENYVNNYEAIVASSGGDYTTLTAALVAGKKKIFIRAGSYTESFSSLPTPLNDVAIYGESQSGTTLTLNSNFNAPATSNRWEWHDLNIAVGANNFGVNNGSSSTNWLFDNVGFSGNATSATVAFNSAYGKFINCYFANSNTSDNQKIAIGGTFTIITGCQFAVAHARTSSSTSDISIGGSTVEISNCVFEATGTTSGTAGFVQSTPNAKFSNCDFLSTGTTGQLLLIRSSATTTVTGCKFQGAATGVLVNNSSGHVITGNTFSNCPTAIDVQTANNTVTGNNIVQTSVTTPTGISIGANDCTVTGNTLLGRTATLAGTGIAVGAMNDTVITGNRVLGYATGITVAASANRTVVAANALNGNTTNYTDSGTGTVITGNSS